MANTIQQDGEFTPLEATCTRCQKTDHATYEFDIYFAGSQFKWSISKRYKEFFALHEKLCKLDIRIKNIKFPPKKPFNNLETEFLIQRKSLLETYLNEVLKLYPIPAKPLAQFIDYHLYEIHGITGVLAQKFFECADIILNQSIQFEFNVLQIFAINERLKSQSPTNVYSEPYYDFTHVMDFVSKLTNLKVTGSTTQFQSSNIIMNKLEFDLSHFTSLGHLQLSNVDVRCMRGLEKMKQSVNYLRVSHSLKSISSIAMGDLLSLGNGDWVFGRDSVSTNSWTLLAHLDFSNNYLTGIDASITLFRSADTVNLSHNLLTRVEHLDSLSNLRKLDLSHNKLGEDFSTLNLKLILGNITDLNLSSNGLLNTAPIRGLYSLIKLNLSNNMITILSDLDHLKTLACLEHLILVGNNVCRQQGYRKYTLALFGDRFSEIRLDMRVADDIEYMQLRTMTSEGASNNPKKNIEEEMKEIKREEKNDVVLEVEENEINIL